MPVIKYQLETNCLFSYDKNGNIVPNPSKEWTGGDENGEWRDGTSRLDALNAQPFGFSVYAKPFLKRVIEYGNGETKVEYSRLNTEKGTYAHWLNCVTSISYNRHKQVMEVECIMGILEENRTFISSRPGCILCRLDEMESWAYLDDLLP